MPNPRVPDHSKPGPDPGVLPPNSITSDTTSPVVLRALSLGPAPPAAAPVAVSNVTSAHAVVSLSSSMDVSLSSGGGGAPSSSLALVMRCPKWMPRDDRRHPSLVAR